MKCTNFKDLEIANRCLYDVFICDHCSIKGFCPFPISADYDYNITAHTLMFEPSNGTISLQCLEIEIINDSLPEDWEVFTLLLSTNNNSAVNLSIKNVDVYIFDGKFSYSSV